MKAMMDSSWKRAACCAATAALVCVSQMSWGQNDAPRPAPQSEGQSSPGGVVPLSVLSGNQADDAFEQYASLKRLAAAWAEMDSALMTDAALQFADGERVLLRSHKAIKASQVLDLAIRLATENKDKESLSRIAKALEKSSDKDRLGQVNLSLKTASAARAVDPVLNEGSSEARSAIQAVQSEIQSAKVAGSKAQLEALEKTLADLPISDKQRAALKKSIAEVGESLGGDKGTELAASRLDQLSGVVRPIGEVKEPEGGKFGGVPDVKDEMPLEEQLAILGKSIENLNAPPPVIGIGLPTSQIAKLSMPARDATWSQYAYSAYGNITIYQYTNNKDYYESQNCGQAAAATVISYHGKAPFYAAINGKTKIQDDMDNNWWHRPDILGRYGTTPLRVQSILHDYKLNTWFMGGGETALRKWVGAKYPCICVVDVGAAGWKDNGKPMSGLHYTVVYAYDANNYWCTNWQVSSKVPRTTFTKSWRGLAGQDFLLAQPK